MRSTVLFHLPHRFWHFFWALWALILISITPWIQPVAWAQPAPWGLPNLFLLPAETPISFVEHGIDGAKAESKVVLLSNHDGVALVPPTQAFLIHQTFSNGSYFVVADVQSRNLSGAITPNDVSLAANYIKTQFESQMGSYQNQPGLLLDSMHAYVRDHLPSEPDIPTNAQLIVKCTALWWVPANSVHEAKARVARAGLVMGAYLHINEKDFDFMNPNTYSRFLAVNYAATDSLGFPGNDALGSSFAGTYPVVEAEVPTAAYVILLSSEYFEDILLPDLSFIGASTMESGFLRLEKWVIATELETVLDVVETFSFESGTLEALIGPEGVATLLMLIKKHQTDMYNHMGGSVIVLHRPHLLGNLEKIAIARGASYTIEQMIKELDKRLQGRRHLGGPALGGAYFRQWPVGLLPNELQVKVNEGQAHVYLRSEDIDSLGNFSRAWLATPDYSMPTLPLMGLNPVDASYNYVNMPYVAPLNFPSVNIGDSDVVLQNFSNSFDEVFPRDAATAFRQLDFNQGPDPAFPNGHRSFILRGTKPSILDPWQKSLYEKDASFLCTNLHICGELASHLTALGEGMNLEGRPNWMIALDPEHLTYSASSGQISGYVNNLYLMIPEDHLLAFDEFDLSTFLAARKTEFDDRLASLWDQVLLENPGATDYELDLAYGLAIEDAFNHGELYPVEVLAGGKSDNPQFYHGFTVVKLTVQSIAIENLRSTLDILEDAMSVAEVANRWILNLVHAVYVELRFFYAQGGELPGGTGHGIDLFWETATEYGTQGFRLYRTSYAEYQRHGRPIEPIAAWLQPEAWTPARGNDVGGASYFYNDPEPTPIDNCRDLDNCIYLYWLEEVETTGDTEIYGPTVATTNSERDSLHLGSHTLPDLAPNRAYGESLRVFDGIGERASYKLLDPFTIGVGDRIRLQAQVHNRSLVATEGERFGIYFRASKSGRNISLPPGVHPVAFSPSPWSGTLYQQRVPGGSKLDTSLTELNPWQVPEAGSYELYVWADMPTRYSTDSVYGNVRELNESNNYSSVAGYGYLMNVWSANDLRHYFNHVPEIRYPEAGTLLNPSEPLTLWWPRMGVEQFILKIGTRPGASDLLPRGVPMRLTQNEVTVNLSSSILRLPIGSSFRSSSNETIYVRLQSRYENDSGYEWESRDITFRRPLETGPLTDTR